MITLKNPFISLLIGFLFFGKITNAQQLSFKNGDTLTTDTYITCHTENNAYVWLGTNKGLVRVDKKNGKQKNFVELNGLSINQPISAICMRKNGQLWAGTAQGILVHDGFYLYTINSENSELLDNSVTSIAEDETETLWIGTEKHGLLKKIRHYYKVYNHFNSNLSCNQIKALIQNNSGVLTVVTGNKQQILTNAIKSTK